MTILGRLNADLVHAMKGGDAPRKDALRFALSVVHNREIEKRSKGAGEPLADADVIEALQKEIKKRKESIALFRKGGRNDLAEKEERDIAYLESYVPAPLTEAELLVVIAEARKKGITEFGPLMKEVMQLAKGRADGRAVGELITRE